jgi:hypothetical protein
MRQELIMFTVYVPNHVRGRPDFYCRAFHNRDRAKDVYCALSTVGVAVGMKDSTGIILHESLALVSRHAAIAKAEASDCGAADQTHDDDLSPDQTRRAASIKRMSDESVMARRARAGLALNC